MKFEWDPRKSVANKKKHSISFEEALTLWSEAHIEVTKIARSDKETRSATLGMVKGKVYVAIWTKRKGRIRIITIRRARKNEEKVYREKI